MHGDACKQYIFKSYNTSIFSAMHFDENPSTRQCEKEGKKGLRVSDFALSLVVFKGHHGSEGVNVFRCPVRPDGGTECSRPPRLLEQQGSQRHDDAAGV